MGLRGEIKDEESESWDLGGYDEWGSVKGDGDEEGTDGNNIGDEEG